MDKALVPLSAVPLCTTCRRPARYLVWPTYSPLRLVCGIHRRGWAPNVCYPLGPAGEKQWTKN
jgi:hypothetical protein